MDKPAPGKKQPYLYPAHTQKELRQKLINPIIGWASLNPSAVINFWYDSKYSTPRAFVNTAKVLAKECIKKQIFNISFKDIRTLKSVQENLDVFSKKLPVYFRVDMLRAIVSYEALQRNNEVCVYSDMDVTPISTLQIFSRKITDYLNEYGFCLADSLYTNYENSFLIFSTYNPSLLKLYRFSIIDLNLKRAHLALQNGYMLDHNRVKETKNSSFLPLTQAVFNSYSNLTSLVYFFKGFVEYQKSYTTMILNALAGQEIFIQKVFGIKSIKPHAMLNFSRAHHRVKKKGALICPTIHVERPGISYHYGDDNAPLYKAPLNVQREEKKRI